MKIFYINSTHWDREWYVPFQNLRYNLVEMVDGLLDILESDPEYRVFCFDGQTIVLEDYLEVAPENARRLEKLIREGRLLIGPWYVMPDEFLVSGESLIRNLMHGHAIARTWGVEAWKYGYVCDIFGHIAQMPQIFHDFGIHGAYISRGAGDQKCSHFVWKAPNGSKVYTTNGGYGAFTRSTIGKFGTEEYARRLERHINALAARSDAPVVVYSNTDDHAYATAHTPQIYKLVEKLFPDAEIVHTDLSQLPLELAKYEESLPVREGELAATNSGGSAELLSHCLSSYYPLKQENDRLQNLLERRIEPLLALCTLDGRPLRHSYADIAYRWLLQNQPHDSICGCSADQVHKDMLYRYDQAREICDRLYEKYCTFTSDGEGVRYALKLFNFTASPKKECRNAQIWFYGDYPTVRYGDAGHEPCNVFKLFDGKGREVPYQILSIRRNVKKRITTKLQTAARFQVYDICFEAEIPAFGYGVYTIEPCKTKVSYPGCLRHGDAWAENDFIRLDIRDNGLLDILDKRTGKRYEKLHDFADNADIGDGWVHQMPMSTAVTYGRGSAATISLCHRGFASVSFRVEKEILLPVCTDATTLLRSREQKPLPIQYTVTLKKDSPRVDIALAVENTVRDHRLRLMLPTGVEGERYFAGQAFCCLERKVGIDPATLTWPEPECIEKNMNGIVGKRDAEGTGLAFVCPEGIHEAAMQDDAEATLAVTLFRCFDRVYLQTEGQRAQLQQPLTFRYALVPLAEETNYADLLDVQHTLAETDICCSVRLADSDTIPEGKSYFELDNPNIRVSIFKCAQDGKGYILRLYNTCEKWQEAVLQVRLPFTDCCFATMNEEYKAPAVCDGNAVKLSFDPWQISTLRIW